MGYVYLIGTTVYGWYKIGKSKTPEVRVRDLGILLPFKIRVFRVWKAENHHLMEKALHEMYAKNQINGEWFQFTRVQLRALIDAIPLRWSSRRTSTISRTSTLTIVRLRIPTTQARCWAFEFKSYVVTSRLKSANNERSNRWRESV
jgi:hypothetical protein